MADLKYAKSTAGSWEIETVDADGYICMFTSLALDTQDNVHISYYGWTTEAVTFFLKYANNTGGYWATENVNSGVKSGCSSGWCV